jgi:outer membrane immunogenic protein
MRRETATRGVGINKEDFMHRDFLFGIGMLASVAVGTGSAVAADIPVRSGPPAVAPATCCAPPPPWVGFYVGIHGGGGWSRESIEESFSFFEPGEAFPLLTPANTNAKGGVFGFQFGHNWQWGPVVGGLEIDFSGADIKETTHFFNPVFFPNDNFTRDVKIDELASARGRLGYLILPPLLLYGTAGIGWGHERTTFAQLTPAFVTSQTSDSSHFGWVAGVGLEWMFWNNWLLRAEWLHYDFGRITNPNNNVFFLEQFIDTGNARLTVDVARAALSYKF